MIVITIGRKFFSFGKIKTLTALVAGLALTSESVATIATHKSNEKNLLICKELLESCVNTCVFKLHAIQKAEEQYADIYMRLKSKLQGEV